MTYQGGLGRTDSGLGQFGLGSEPGASGISVRFGILLGERVTLAVPDALAVRFGIALGARPTARQTHAAGLPYATYAGVSQGNAGGGGLGTPAASFVVTPPSGARSGDGLALVVATSTYVPTCSGWTQRQHWSTTALNLTVLTHQFAGEPSWTFALSGGDGIAWACVAVAEAVDGAMLDGVADALASATPANPSLTGPTPAHDDDLELAVIAQQLGNPGAQPAGFAQIAAQSAYQSVGLTLAWRRAGTAGPVGTVTWPTAPSAASYVLADLLVAATRSGLRFGVAVGLRATGVGVGPNVAAARFGVLLGGRPMAQQVHVAAARFGLLPGLRATAQQTHAAGARFGVLVGHEIVSTGPGSGVVTETDLQDWLNSLREGDQFPCTLPYAGLSGRSGVARVLARTVDAQGVLTFKLQFIPTTDAPAAVAEALSGAPRFVPPLRQDVGRRLANLEHKVG